VRADVERVQTLRHRLDDVMTSFELEDPDLMAEAETGIPALPPPTSRGSRSARCCRVSTTPATRSSPSARRRAGSTRPTSPRCCSGCTRATSSGTAGPWTSSTPPTPKRRASSRRRSRSTPPTPTGRSPVSRALTAWCASRPSTTRAGARPRSRASRCSRSSSRATWSRSRTTSCASMVYRSSGPGGQGRQHHRLRCAAHPPADQHRRVLSERAQPDPEPRERDARAPGQAPRAPPPGGAGEDGRDEGRQRRVVGQTRSGPTCCTRTRW